MLTRLISKFPELNYFLEVTFPLGDLIEVIDLKMDLWYFCLETMF